MVVDIHVAEQFKGPMDLLLYLIKRDEVDIYDIPISHITNEYMKALNEMPEIDVDVGGEFAAMASMLMEIKAKLMLPPEEVEEDDEVVELDPRAGLVEALLEYKKFKEAAGDLDSLMEQHAARFPRIAPSLEREEEVTPEEEKIDANVYELFGRMAQLMRETLAQTAATTIVATEISTEECIDSIQEKIKVKGRVGFTDLLSEAPTREEMVVYFIAILELIRLRKVVPFQAEDFSEIYLEEPSENGHVTPIEDAPGFRRLTAITNQFSRAARILHLPLPGARTQSVAAKHPTAPSFLSPLPRRNTATRSAAGPRPFLPFRGRALPRRTKARALPLFPGHLSETRRVQQDLLVTAMLRALAPTHSIPEPTPASAEESPASSPPQTISRDQVQCLIAEAIRIAGSAPDALFCGEEPNETMLRSFLAAYLCFPAAALAWMDQEGTDPNATTP
ncbi:MAG: segregation and condensation protein A [Planctomycetota bacterium]|jgi:segregation and condensation protein A